MMSITTDAAVEVVGYQRHCQYVCEVSSQADAEPSTSTTQETTGYI